MDHILQETKGKTMTKSTDNSSSYVQIFDSYQEAVEGVRKIREASDIGDDLITKIKESPYGGYNVICIPAEVYVDLVTEGVHLHKIGSVYNDRVLA